MHRLPGRWVMDAGRWSPERNGGGSSHGKLGGRGMTTSGLSGGRGEDSLQKSVSGEQSVEKGDPRFVVVRRLRERARACKAKGRKNAHARGRTGGPTTATEYTPEEQENWDDSRHDGSRSG